MKKGLKIIGIILIVIILISITLNIMEKMQNMKAKKEAIIVKVTENSLLVVDKNNRISLNRVRFTPKGDIGYKQGQEILIYYSGMTSSLYPGILEGVGKIKIVKDKSDMEIPESILRECYSSRKNVDLKINELTPNGIYLKISDFNELKYNYPHSYTLQKRIKNENYTGEGGTYIEAPEGGTPAYIPPKESEYKWVELNAKSNISSEDTEVEVSGATNIIHRKFDWTELYGELDERKI